MAREYLICINVNCPNSDEVMMRMPRRKDYDPINCDICGEPMDIVDYRTMETEPFRSRGCAA